MITYGTLADGSAYLPPRPVSLDLPADLSREAPCERCGTLVHPMRLPVDWSAPEFAICPLSDWPGCYGRELARTRAAGERAAREAAQRSAEVAASALSGAARARQEAVPAAAGSPAPVRPSQARKTLLGAAMTRQKPGPAASQT